MLLKHILKAKTVNNKAEVLLNPCSCMHKTTKNNYLPSAIEKEQETEIENY